MGKKSKTKRSRSLVAMSEEEVCRCLGIELEELRENRERGEKHKIGGTDRWRGVDINGLSWNNLGRDKSYRYDGIETKSYVDHDLVKVEREPSVVRNG